MMKETWMCTQELSTEREISKPKRRGASFEGESSNRRFCEKSERHGRHRSRARLDQSGGEKKPIVHMRGVISKSHHEGKIPKA